MSRMTPTICIDLRKFNLGFIFQSYAKDLWVVLEGKNLNLIIKEIREECMYWTMVIWDEKILEFWNIYKFFMHELGVHQAFSGNISIYMYDWTMFMCFGH